MLAVRRRASVSEPFGAVLTVVSNPTYGELIARGNRFKDDLKENPQMFFCRIMMKNTMACGG